MPIVFGKSLDVAMCVCSWTDALVQGGSSFVPKQGGDESSMFILFSCLYICLGICVL